MASAEESSSFKIFIFSFLGKSFPKEDTCPKKSDSIPFCTAKR